MGHWKFNGSKRIIILNQTLRFICNQKSSSSSPFADRTCAGSRKLLWKQTAFLEPNSCRLLTGACSLHCLVLNDSSFIWEAQSLVVGREPCRMPVPSAVARKSLWRKAYILLQTGGEFFQEGSSSEGPSLSVHSFIFSLFDNWVSDTSFSLTLSFKHRSRFCELFLYCGLGSMF